MSDMQKVYDVVVSIQQDQKQFINAFHEQTKGCAALLTKFQEHLDEVEAKKKSVKKKGNGGNGDGRILPLTGSRW